MTPHASHRLDGWKQIADFARTSVRTVQRWEKEHGLPVHRIDALERSTVFASEAEIRAWLIAWCRRSHESTGPGVASVTARPAGVDALRGPAPSVPPMGALRAVVPGVLGFLGGLTRLWRFRVPTAG